MAKYHIIWADDDVHALIKGAADNLKDHDFEVVARCTCGQQLQRVMSEISIGRVDAVVVDANFPDEDEDENFHDRQTEGLETAVALLQKYSEIPFYLFSGKGKLVASQTERVRRHFAPRKAIFDKGNGIEPLLKRIKEDVEYRRTSEFVVDNNFSEALKDARDFDSVLKVTEAEKFVRQNLIRSYDCRWDYVAGRPQEILTSARKIIESMFDFLKSPMLAIIPPIEELNSISQFISGRSVDSCNLTYQLNRGMQIMPRPLARALWYCLDIVQDGSHLKGDLKLGVDSYLTSTKNSNIIRSILHIIIDLLRWFVSYVPYHMKVEENKNYWTAIEK